MAHKGFAALTLTTVGSSIDNSVDGTIEVSTEAVVGLYDSEDAETYDAKIILTRQAVREIAEAAGLRVVEAAER